MNFKQMHQFNYRLPELLTNYLHLIHSTVVTLCSEADANCPVSPKNVTKEHWGFDDPAGKDWSEFQRVRDEIKVAIETFAHRE